MDLLLRGGRIIDPAEKIDGNKDILIEKGKITRIGSDLFSETNTTVKIIDLKGKIIVPGLIDMHVHFRDPGFVKKENIESGAAAAAAGGFTTVVCMPNTNPVIDNIETIEYILDKAATAPCDILMMGSITIGLNGEVCSPYEEMKSCGIVGITDDGKSVMDSGILYIAMCAAKELNLPVSCHCEDSNLTFDRTINKGRVAKDLDLHGVPALAEEIIIQRDISIAEETGVHLHIQHISTANGVEMVRQAKARGCRISAEAAPHHFTLTEEAILLYGTNAKMSPPLRTKDDVIAIINGLVDGTIDVIADDHAPHTALEKDSNLITAPNGIIGLETTLSISINSLVDSGYLTLHELIKKLTINPAKILNINKGFIKEGIDANITIIDLDKEWIVDSSKFYSKAKNTPFDGMKLKGKAVMTIYNGDIVFEEDIFNV